MTPEEQHAVNKSIESIVNAYGDAIDKYTDDETSQAIKSYAAIVILEKALRALREESSTANRPPAAKDDPGSLGKTPPPSQPGSKDDNPYDWGGFLSSWPDEQQ